MIYIKKISTAFLNKAALLEMNKARKIKTHINNLCVVFVHDAVLLHIHNHLTTQKKHSTAFLNKTMLLHIHIDLKTKKFSTAFLNKAMLRAKFGDCVCKPSCSHAS